MERLIFTSWGVAALMACSIGILIITEKLGKRITLHKGIVTHKEYFEGVSKIVFLYKVGRLSDPSRLTVLTDDDEIVTVLGSGAEVEINDSIYFTREENLRGFVYNILVD